MKSYSGACQCGAVAYRVSGEALTLFACHCTDCQRQSASAFGMALWLRGAELTLLRGSLASWTRDLPSGRQMACRFCPVCGSRLFHQVVGSEILSIKPGSLDDSTGLQPAGHIWTDSAQPWVRPALQGLCYPGNPDGFGELMEAWHHEDRR